MINRAGPAGVELAGELQDFVEQDVPKYYPELLKVSHIARCLTGYIILWVNPLCLSLQFVKIKLVTAGDRVLKAFDKVSSRSHRKQ